MTSRFFAYACFALWLGCSSSGGTPAPKDAGQASGGDGDHTGPGKDGSAGGPDGSIGGMDGGHPGGDGDGNGNGDGDSNVDAGQGPIKHTYVYLGGYDQGGHYPFRVFELNRDTGALTQLGDPVDMGSRPSFVTPSADGRFLYVANEVGDETGGVTVGKIDRTNGSVKQIDHATTNVDFVFTNVSPNGKYVLAASYDGGQASVFPINSDGTIEDAVDTQVFGGWAHSIRADASGRWAYVPNKQKDEVEQLTFNSASGQLDVNPKQSAFNTGAGSGPRHVALHKDGKHVYVMCENQPRLLAFEIKDDGTLNKIDDQRTVPQDAVGDQGAHVLVHPSGKFVYVSNRRETTISAFAIGSDGKLTFIESESTRGDHPRNFDIDPAGEFLIVANMNSGTLGVFRIASDGSLNAVGDLIDGLGQPNAVSIINVH